MRIYTRIAPWTLLFLGTFAQALTVEVKPIGPNEQEAAAAVQKILASAALRERLAGKRFKVLATQFDEEEKGSVPPRALLHIYDYDNDELLHVAAPFDASRDPLVNRADEEFPATNEEFAEAVAVLKRDPALGSGIERGEWKLYEPMPPALRLPAYGKNRIVTVGLHPQVAGLKAEIVGVNLSRPAVIRFRGRAPPRARATDQNCGYPNAGQFTTIRGMPGEAEVTVKDGSAILWNFTVVRPSASSGIFGSGLELKGVRYRGRLLLARAHTPIINVRYERDACGPFRDWTAENPFVANGQLLGLGIMKADTRPSTIFDSGSDRGNFRGVAIYAEGDRVELVTELSAGWYRYVSEFHFHADGTIEPRFRFSGVENSCVCKTHFHHVYWRFDFDLGESGNNFVETSSDRLTWRRVDKEVEQRKSRRLQFWRVRDAENWGYELTPGANDGSADAYAKADVWLLRYHWWELDDFTARRSTAAELGAFVNGEDLTDVVLWYGAHFSHTEDAGDSAVGPTLRPVR